MTVASGTSTPTSTTVVPTSTSSSPIPEPGHLGVALGGLQPAVDEADPERRQKHAQTFRLALRRNRALVVRVLDRRHDDERPVALGGLGPDELPQPIDVGRVTDPGLDRDPSLRLRAQIGDIEIGVHDLAERARDRGRGHEQDVRRGSSRLGLELAALLDPEPVLLVDDDQPEVGERDPVLEQGVGSDDDLCAAVGERLQRVPGSSRAERPGQERDRDAEPVEEVGQCRRVLTRQEIRRREHGGLATDPRHRGPARTRRPRSCPNRRRPGGAGASARAARDRSGSRPWRPAGPA